MQTAKMENWSIGNHLPNPYAAPELGVPVVQGKVYGHPNFTDGASISSSPLVEINFEEGYVLSKNTRFELGAIDPKYYEFIAKEPKRYQGIERYKPV